MIIRLRLFAIYREKVGRSELDMAVPEGTSAGGVLEKLVSDYPSLSALRDVTMFAIDEEFVPADTKLKDGQQLALVPPVSGG